MKFAFAQGWKRSLGEWYRGKEWKTHCVSRRLRRDYTCWTKVALQKKLRKIEDV